MKSIIKELSIKKSLKSIVLIVLGILFIVLMALKKLPIPGTTIQMSLQSLSISILAVVLGKEAFRIVLIYLALATIGLPVLASGGADPVWFFSASSGSILDF